MSNVFRVKKRKEDKMKSLILIILLVNASAIAKERSVDHMGSKLVTYNDQNWVYTKAPRPLPSHIQIFQSKKISNVIGYFEYKIMGAKNKKFKKGKFLKSECKRYGGKGIASKVVKHHNNDFCEVTISSSKNKNKKIYVNEKVIKLSKQDVVILQSISFESPKLVKAKLAEEEYKHFIKGML